MSAGPLAGRSVVVTRSPDRAGGLAERLRAQGAVVVEVPTIQVVDAGDGGAALRAAAERVADYDWVVFTSPNGVSRLVAALPGGPARVGAWPLVAVVGPGTAEVAQAYGLPVDLVPERFVAEGLLEVFPPGPGRVLLPQAAAARPVLAEGLRARGWAVDAVEAYRTVPATLPPELVEQARRADAITFTSSSTVANYVGAAGADAVPPVVVCIGPVTAATARERGLTVAAVADAHSVDGLVAAVVAALAP